MDRRRRFSAFVAGGHDPRPTILHALEFCRDFVTGSCLDERARVKAAIIVEELVSNLLRHGGKDKDIALCLQVADHADGVSFEIEDDGAAFDPLADNSAGGIDPVSGGGVGLAIVRAWGEDLHYSRRAERNRLTLMIR